MKDNFVQEEEESLSDFFEQRRSEFRAQNRRKWVMKIGTIACTVFGVVTLANFDVRIGIGVGLLVMAIVIYLLEI